MYTEQDLLNLMKTSGLISQKNSENSTSSWQTTQPTGDFDYQAWYNSPDNSIRRWDEEHGVHLDIDESGILRFVADKDLLFPPSEPERVFPEYFQSRTFDRFATNIYPYGEPQNNAKTALQKAQRYALNVDRIMEQMNGKGLYFFSKTKGSGKTFLSTILGNELTRKGKRVLWHSMPNLLQEIKSGFDRESGISSSEVIDRTKRVEMLILDDIGVEKQSAWVNETLFMILDYRLTTGKPTFFTSNYAPDDLSYDERIIDRIRSMTALIPLPEVNVRKLMRNSSQFEEFLGK